jgi:hypothetical protein
MGEWLPLAIGAKEGGGGALLPLCPKERLAFPYGEGRPFGLWEPLREGAHPRPLPSLAKRLAPPSLGGKAYDLREGPSDA